MKTILTMLFLTAALALTKIFFSSNKNNSKMKIAVWDTYVTKKDKTIMHFDIVVPTTLKDTSIIYGYGKEYLATKGQEGQALTSKECRFCHVEKAPEDIENIINQKGYYIIEMQGCN